MSGRVQGSNVRLQSLCEGREVLRTALRRSGIWAAPIYGFPFCLLHNVQAAEIMLPVEEG